MNRKIQFRGKGYHDGVWRYGNLIVTDENDITILNKEDEYDVIPESVGQFVGMLDKTGVEIFEGDIVRTDVGACNFVDGTAGEVTFLRIVGYNDNAAFEPFSEFKYEHYDWEVIGNIHDCIITYDGKKYTAKVLPYKKGEDYCAKCHLDPDKCRLGFSFNVCEIFNYLQDEDTIQVLEEVADAPDILKESGEGVDEKGGEE